MGQAQAPSALILPKEYPLNLPSGIAKVTMREMSARDQMMAAKRFDREKDDQYSLEMLRLITLAPGSVSQDTPAGTPAFSDDQMLDLSMKDVNYLTAAMRQLNGLEDGEVGADGKKKPRYVFDF
jgi:hypothetical protein